MFGKTVGDMPEAGKIPERMAYSTSEVAALLGGVTERYVHQLIAEKTLPSIKLGRRRLVEHEALLTFVAGLREDDATARTSA